MSRILTLNAGSSSLKFGLFETGEEPRPLVSGHVDGIGRDPTVTIRRGTREDRFPGEAAATHAEALRTALAHVELDGIVAVGHRIVHGGPDFAAPLRLDPAILARLEGFVPMAPLHQPHNLAGVRAAMLHFPRAVQVACFDTGFHRGHPFVNDTYALPRTYYDRGVRRYGFHGLSYEYVAGALEGIAPDLHEGRTAVLHLGSGASICALSGGKSVASTMGFSALDGLPMGTRSGQIDPGVLLWLMESEGMDAAAISDLLYRRSGLLGLSGRSGDMRDLEAAGTEAAEQAIAYFTARIRRELAAMAVAMGGLDGIVFTGGIGENSSRIRTEVCGPLRWLGIEIDLAENAIHAPVISSAHSLVEVWVLPTDEERVIARATARLA